MYLTNGNLFSSLYFDEGYGCQDGRHPLPRIALAKQNKGEHPHDFVSSFFNTTDGKYPRQDTSICGEPTTWS